MTESEKTSRRRGRRSTRVSQQLEAARRRNAEQLAAQRRQEKAVEVALADFFGAEDERAAVEAECARRVEPHQRAIARLQQERDLRIAAVQERQAEAAAAIHDADRTVAQVGEVLGIGEKAARRLIAAGRDAPGDAEAASPGEPGKNAGVDRHAGGHPVGGGTAETVGGNSGDGGGTGTCA